MFKAMPYVFANGIFAMKGGTAINLFVRDMPRLSVDIDVTYIQRQTPRGEALNAISAELDAIASRLRAIGLAARKVPGKASNDSKLIVESDRVQAMVEVNLVFRGTVLPTERRCLHPNIASAFNVDLEAPILAVDELYGGKLVAALDRQYPRDLFDVWRIFEAGGLSDAMIECFVIYLAGHNRPTHEVLFSSDKDISRGYSGNFVGTTAEPVKLSTLLEARAALRKDLPRRLTSRHRQFLIGLTRGSPDWTLAECSHAAELPALRWKLTNLEIFRQRRPADFENQARILEQRLG